MAMTKRDFEEMARIIQSEVKPALSIAEFGILPEHRIAAQGTVDCCRRIANSLATMAEQSNPRFDEARFIKACGF